MELVTNLVMADVARKENLDKDEVYAERVALQAETDTYMWPNPAADKTLPRQAPRPRDRHAGRLEDPRRELA